MVTGRSYVQRGGATIVADINSCTSLYEDRNDLKTTFPRRMKQSGGKIPPTADRRPTFLVQVPPPHLNERSHNLQLPLHRRRPPILSLDDLSPMHFAADALEEASGRKVLVSTVVYAQLKGLSPLSAALLTSAFPSSTSILHTSKCPLRAARGNAVPPRQENVVQPAKLVNPVPAFSFASCSPTEMSPCSAALARLFPAIRLQAFATLIKAKCGGKEIGRAGQRGATARTAIYIYVYCRVCM